MSQSCSTYLARVVLFMTMTAHCDLLDKHHGYAGSMACLVILMTFMATELLCFRGLPVCAVVSLAMLSSGLRLLVTNLMAFDVLQQRVSCDIAWGVTSTGTHLRSAMITMCCRSGEIMLGLGLFNASGLA